MRWLSPETTFNKAAATILFEDNSYIPYVLAFLNSVVARTILNMINPTLNTNIKDILALPLIISEDNRADIETLAKECIEISKEDWDSFETSWDFKKHPLIRENKTIRESFESGVKSARNALNI